MSIEKQETILYCISKNRLVEILKDHESEKKFLYTRALKRYIYFKKIRNENREAMLK